MVTTTMCVSGMVLAKAGTNHSTDLDGTAAAMVGTDFIVDLWIVEAESFINVLTRNNYTDSYSTLNDDVKKILQEAASNLAAMYAVSYDMSGYTSRVEAEDILNILFVRFRQCIKLLDQNAVTYINGA